jgi:hypothetical protein
LGLSVGGRLPDGQPAAKAYLSAATEAGGHQSNALGKRDFSALSTTFSSMLGGLVAATVSRACWSP